MKTFFSFSGWRLPKFLHSKFVGEKINSQFSTARRTGRGIFQWDSKQSALKTSSDVLHLYECNERLLVFYG